MGIHAAIVTRPQHTGCRKPTGGHALPRGEDERRIARIFYRIIIVEARYTALQVARWCGVSTAAVYHWCVARRTPSLVTIRRLLMASGDRELGAELLLLRTPEDKGRP